MIGSGGLIGIIIEIILGICFVCGVFSLVIRLNGLNCC